MREPPRHLDSDELLTVVRREWDHDVTRVEHLPLGFGAHHWTAYDADEPLLFVTFDQTGPKRTADDLEAAYAGAVALLLAGLEFVLAPLPSTSGSPIVRFGDGALSCTMWRHGRSGGALDVAWTTRVLERLHAASPPAGIPTWKPVVPAGFADGMELRLQQPWGPGPYADLAHKAVGEHLAELVGWTARYHELARRAHECDWVVTHGEPHSDNQLATDRSRYLVDWESLKLAPPERDLQVLLDAGEARVDADPDMLALFDLEWRLREIDEYASWFEAEHADTADDRIGFGDLLEELHRP